MQDPISECFGSLFLETCWDETHGMGMVQNCIHRNLRVYDVLYIITHIYIYIHCKWILGSSIWPMSAWDAAAQIVTRWPFNQLPIPREIFQRHRGKNIHHSSKNFLAMGCCKKNCCCLWCPCCFCLGVVQLDMLQMVGLRVWQPATGARDASANGDVWASTMQLGINCVVQWALNALTSRICRAGF